MKLRVNNQMLNNVVGETYKGYEALFSEINAMESDINNLKKVRKKIKKMKAMIS